MSRVADAVSRAAGESSAPDTFNDEDHPWGSDLAAASFVDVAEPPPAARGFESRLHAAAPPLPATERRTRAVEPPPPRTASDVDPGLRQHLSALVERVFAPVSGNPARSVAFSGLDARSSVITAVTAEMLARQTGASVCVVDANFTSPSLHEYFGVENEAGLIDAVDGNISLVDAAREVGPNLWLLPSGRARRRPSFASDSVRVKIAHFIARFDYVLADIEPVSGISDATGLAPLVNGVILVIAADATRRESAKRAAQVLQGIGAPVLGAVLTNRRFPIPDALYRRL